MACTREAKDSNPLDGVELVGDHVRRRTPADRGGRSACRPPPPCLSAPARRGDEPCCRRCCRPARPRCRRCAAVEDAVRVRKRRWRRGCSCHQWAPVCAKAVERRKQIQEPESRRKPITDRILLRPKASEFCILYSVILTSEFPNINDFAPAEHRPQHPRINCRLGCCRWLGRPLGRRLKDVLAAARRRSAGGFSRPLLLLQLFRLQAGPVARVSGGFRWPTRGRPPSHSGRPAASCLITFARSASRAAATGCAAGAPWRAGRRTHPLGVEHRDQRLADAKIHDRRFDIEFRIGPEGLGGQS